MEKGMEAFIEDLKSRQISEYPLAELQDKIDTVAYYHKISRSKSEKQVFRELYEKMAAYYNKKAGMKTYKETL